MVTVPGLRERKKIETRQRISDVATAMFTMRGFDNVTVAEIAEAANVSKMTVFNYFPRKEDLFFDRGPEAVDLVTRAIRERAEGETPVAALRRLLLDLLEHRHPLAAVGEGFATFWQVVVDSPALQARAREAADEAEELIGALLAEADGRDPDEPANRLAAALIVAACRTVYLTAVRRQLAGERADDIAPDHMALINYAFDTLDRMIGTTSRK
jgi:AcrR family transcriptional regulator